MERKQLLKSQQEFLRMKLGQAHAAQAEAQAALDLVAAELSIDPSEKWTLTQDLLYLEKPRPAEGEK